MPTMTSVALMTASAGSPTFRSRDSIASLVMEPEITLPSAISNEAIESLGLKVGYPALAVIKATDVMVGIE